MGGDSVGQRAGTNPSVVLAAALSRRKKLEEELFNIEKQFMGVDSVRQRVGTNPSVLLAAALSRKKKLEELFNIEKQVYDLETSYLQDSNQGGNVLKGFEGFLSSSKNTINLKRSRKFQPEDRMFSLSSVTSPAVEEQMAGRDDGRADYRPRGGVTPNGQGKPKKAGRITLREGKRTRPTSEDMDDEDDLDVSFR